MSSTNKHIWLAKTLLDAGNQGLTLQELQHKWENASINDLNDDLPRQTFNRWRKALLNLLGIEISCNLSNNKYYISNPEVLESSACGQKSNNLSHWLIDTYTTFNSLSRFIVLKNRILVDEIPSSHTYLTTILEAMKSNCVIDIVYQDFFGSNPHQANLAPYCLRLTQKRWYTLAYNLSEKRLKTYSLDRIQNLTVTEKTFKIPKRFNAKNFFSEHFGIVTGTDCEPQHIVLRAYFSHPDYLRSLPLHHSQKEIDSNDHYTDFEYFLKPTYDFIMEILKYHNLIEVIKPESLRQEIKEKISQTLDLYK